MISYQLLHQIAPKFLILDLIKETNLLDYEPDASKIICEGWHVGLRLVVRKAFRGVEVLKGHSTIISYKLIAKFYERYLDWKSSKIEVEIARGDRFRVTSSQDPTHKYFVYANPTNLYCGCMKFHCLRNRMGEARKFFDSLNKFQIEVFNLDKNKIEIYKQPTCHHIKAVMKFVFGADSLQEYAEVYRSVTSSIQAIEDAERYRENPWGSPHPGQRRRF